MANDTPVESPRWALLRTSPDEPQVDGWALVLHALDIEHQVESSDAGYRLWVSAAKAAQAAAALEATDGEAAESAALAPPPVPDRGTSVAGLAVAVALPAFFLVTGGRDAGDDAHGWFAAGAATADRILAGQWWRTITALTLHADAMHVLGNAVASLIFVAALGRWLGDGLALLLTLLAGAGGNLVTAYLYGGGHNSVGASTATFGALGILGGLQILRWLRPSPRDHFGLRRAYTVLAACLGLFAMLGVGERADVVAHAAGLGLGLVFGLALGLAVGSLLRRPVGWIGQSLSLLATVSTLAGAWWAALR